MNKLYSVHDHWTDIAKKNDVDIESIDGVITGIKVNGEDYGGGESDFVICVDSRSVKSLKLFTHDITGDTPPEPNVEITAGNGQSFSNPVYFIDNGYYITTLYGTITEMGHVLDNPDYPVYYKVEGDLFIRLTGNIPS